MGRFGTTVKEFRKESIRAVSAQEASSNSLENLALSVITVCALLAAGLSCEVMQPAQAKKAAKSKEAASPATDTPSSTSAPSQAIESAYPAIDRMEKFLFLRVFYDEDAETRLTRLDKEVFGDPNEGSVEERMAKLDTVLAPKMKAKDEQQERAKAEAEAASAAATAAAKPTPAAPQQSEAELAAERARIAAQAAREQEIKGLLSEAANHWRAKKGPEALERFEQVLRLDPQNSEAQFSMGVIEESRGKLNQALSRYEQAAKIDPDNPDFSEAIAAIQKKIKSGGVPAGPQGDAKRLRDSATLAFKSGEYFSALDLYKQLDDKVPNQALTKYNIGSIYLMLKDHYNALEYYQQAHKLDGSDERFTKAYNDLSAEMKKTRGALEENKKTAEAEWNPPTGAGNKPKSSKKGKDKPPQQNAQQGGGSSPGKVATNPGYQQAPYQQPQQPRQQFQPPQQQQPPRPQQRYQQPPQQYQQPPQQQYLQPPQQQYLQPPQQQYQQPPQQQYLQPPQQQYLQPPQQQYLQPPQQQYQQPPQQQYQQPPQQQYQQPPQQQYQQPQQQYQQPPQQQYLQPAQQYQQSPVQPVFSTAPVQQYQQPQQSGGLSSFGIRGKSTSDGVMVTAVSGGSRASRAGLTNGDVIRTVDGNEVTQTSQLEQALGNAPGSLQMLVFRNGSLVVLNF